MLTSSSSADISLWYERYAPSLRSIAARITRNPDDADDALQDTFVAAWRFRGSFDGERSPLPWLTTIARRKALTIVSRRGSAPAGAVQPPAPSAEEEALRRQADAAARRLARTEPAFALSALGGLPRRAVGDLLGVPMRTAASRILRGRRRIAARLSATIPAPERSKAAWSNSS